MTVLAGAQTLKADPDADPAAMERARRQADSPMRLILQAAKLRRSADRAAADRGSSGGIAAAGTTADVTPDSEADPSAAALGVIRPRSVAKPDLAPALGRVDSGRLAEPVAIAAPSMSPLGAVVPAGVLADPPAAGAPTLALPVPLPVPLPLDPLAQNALSAPKLLEMVEPAVPARVLDQLRTALEVQVDLTIRADGSVAAAEVAATNPRELKRYVTEAVLRWRYAPLPAQQVQRVRIVFKPA